LGKLMRSQQSKNSSSSNASSHTTSVETSQTPSATTFFATSDVHANPVEPSDAVAEGDDADFHDYVVPLKMKNLDKWESRHCPQIYLKAKYVPYPALRQQFWRAMLRQYDTDESGEISRVELTTMLDTLGSTLRESTIDSFFQRFPHKAADNEETWDLTKDEAVICLEDQLQAKSKPTTAVDKLKSMMPDLRQLGIHNKPDIVGELSSTNVSGTSTPQIMIEPQTPIDRRSSGGDDSDENGDKYEEHVVEIRECPICHQPRLNKRSDTDIITHIATCASQDWRQVNTVLMGGYVTASQAQRKWYSKVITKISYGGYKLGANSANILVQDRMTGQINEEKMSVYVRLGIRLLYKGLKSRDMENKRSECFPPLVPPSPSPCTWPWMAFDSSSGMHACIDSD
jgi:phosphatidylserine decarboxylase